MSDDVLQGYLEQIIDGNESVRAAFYQQFARSTVHVPATVKENNHIVRCAIALIEEYARPTIPVFLGVEEVNVWLKQQRPGSDATLVSLLGADLCSSLDISTQIAVCPGSNATLLIGPEQIDNIASTPFDPPHNSELTTSASDMTDQYLLADEEPEVKTAEPLNKFENLNLASESSQETSKLPPSWLDSEDLLIASDEEERPSAVMFNDAPPLIEEIKLGSHIIPKKVATAEKAPDTNVMSAESIQKEKNDVMGLMHDDELQIASDSILEDNSDTPAMDNGATQFLRPLQRGMADSIQERFVRQPRRRFGES